MIDRNSGWRPGFDHIYPYAKGEPHRVKDKFPATKCFDQVYYIGDTWCCSPLIETEDGLILIDAMEPDMEHVQLILEGIKETGHAPSELKTILITHGHVDHWGKADYFRDNFGTKLYMSRKDEEYAHLPNTRSPFGPMPFSVDGYIEGGDVFKQGGMEIKVVSTPGHTVGCLSFLIPVTDCGVPHKMALWGGAGIPREYDEKLAFIKSCEEFAQICREEGADGEISNHPFVDLTVERLAICRRLVNGMAHPFVIGVEATAQYHLENKKRCEAAL